MGGRGHVRALSHSPSPEWKLAQKSAARQNTPMRVLVLGIDTLVLIAMLLQMYSGIVMSRHVFSYLRIEGGMMLARAAAYSRRLLGVCLDEPSSWAALEHVDGNGKKTVWAGKAIER